MKNMLIDVLIVDDEAFIREGLKYMIEWEELGFTICDEAENGEEAVEKILDMFARTKNNYEFVNMVKKMKFL